MAKDEIKEKNKKMENTVSKTKKVATKKKATTKVAQKMTDTTIKTSTKKQAPAKKKATTTRKSSTSKKKKAVSNLLEYYDLPNTYNQTTVKLLFQTPKKLFVYWEISEEDKQKYLTENGNDFFERTTPFLVVINKTKSYSFEVEINDFANSWYFDVPDSNCEYEVSLIRKNKSTNNATFITTSNELEVPNNHILFEQNRKEIFFKNVKTNDVTSQSVVNLQFINHLGNAYNANAFYKKFYTEEELVQISNPTSN